VQDFGWEIEGRRPLGRPRCKWEDNIKMTLQKVEWRAWTGLIWHRIGTGVYSSRGSIKCREFLDQLRTC